MSATLRRKPPPDPFHGVRAAICALWLALLAMCAQGFFAAPNGGDLLWGLFDAYQFRSSYTELRG